MAVSVRVANSFFKNDNIVAFAKFFLQRWPRRMYNVLHIGSFLGNTSRITSSFFVRVSTTSFFDDLRRILVICVMGALGRVLKSIYFT